MTGTTGTNMAMIALSAYVTLFISNIYFDEILGIALSINGTGAITHIDSRDRYQVVEDMREEGQDAYPIAVPAHLITRAPNEWVEGDPKLIPLAGIANVTTVYCNENGYYTHYTSDRYGFNNPDHVWDERNPDFILIGDSFVHGACVWPDQDIAGRLRAENYRTLNLGMGGDGPLLELATLNEYARGFRPAAVLWFYYEGNDLSFLQTEMKFSYLGNYLDSAYSRGLINKQDEINRIWRGVIRDEERKREEQAHKESGGCGNRIASRLTLCNITRFIREQFDAWTGRHKWNNDKRVEDVMVNFEIDSKRSLPIFSAVIGQAREVSREIGAELIFVYLPSYEKYAYSAKTYHDDVIEVVQDLDIKVIDFSDFLNKQSEPLKYFPFGRRGHYTPETYAILSDFVVRQLEQGMVIHRAD